MSRTSSGIDRLVVALFRGLSRHSREKVCRLLQLQAEEESDEENLDGHSCSNDGHGERER